MATEIQATMQSSLETSAGALTGVLFVFVGPSGAGKNQIIELLMPRVPELQRLPTATTRTARPNEVEGRDHFFVSDARFQEMIDRRELVEYQQIHLGKSYGTVRQPLLKALSEGRSLLADIDIAGALALRQEFPQHTVTIFVSPPSLQDLRERILQRTPNISAAELDERLARAEREMQHAAECQYQVTNDDLLLCVAECEVIVRRELLRRSRDQRAS